MSRRPEAANFGDVLRYAARRYPMYFPAGIPLVALVAFIAWSIKQETDRSRNSGNAGSSRSKS